MLWYKVAIGVIGMFFVNILVGITLNIVELGIGSEDGGGDEGGEGEGEEGEEGGEEGGDEGGERRLQAAKFVNHSIHSLTYKHPDNLNLSSLSFSSSLSSATSLISSSASKYYKSLQNITSMRFRRRR